VRREVLHEKLVEGVESRELELWELRFGTLAHSLLSSAFAAAILIHVNIVKVVW
jgi:hypothetical protein